LAAPFEIVAMDDESHSRLQAVIDTPAVPFSVQGDAEFVGNLGSVPTPCANPLFLVRLPANNRWIAAGAVRVIGD
jgi:hypothetical protein